MAKRLKFGPEGPVAKAFSPGDLNRVCTMAEENFGRAYGMTKYTIKKRKGSKNNFFFFQDNGSDILFVAHLDTVAQAKDAQELAKKRAAHFVNTEAGPIVYSRALDDRLGAYIILELLPKLGITGDVLLTVGEESGQSTAEFFNPDKKYNWMMEFDRGGSDVVMYAYADKAHEDLIRAVGAKVGNGIFSDICELEHLGCKGFNWGTGYQEYHTSRAHAYLNETFEMVTRFLRFHEVLHDVAMPHERNTTWSRFRGKSSGGTKSYTGGGYDYYSEWDIRPHTTTGPHTGAPQSKGTSPGVNGTQIPRGADQRRGGSRYGPVAINPAVKADVADEKEGDSTPSKEVVPVTDPFMVSDEHPGVVLSKAEQDKVLVKIDSVLDEFDDAVTSAPTVPN